jgi:hypothetical protein
MVVWRFRFCSMGPGLPRQRAISLDGCQMGWSNCREGRRPRAPGTARPKSFRGVRARDLLTCFTRNRHASTAGVVRGHSSPASGVLQCCAEHSIHKGYVVIELDPKGSPALPAVTTSDSGSALGSSGPARTRRGAKFRLKHLSLGFAFWSHPITQPSS